MNPVLEKTVENPSDDLWSSYIPDSSLTPDTEILN